MTTEKELKKLKEIYEKEKGQAEIEKEAAELKHKLLNYKPTLAFINYSPCYKLLNMTQRERNEVGFFVIAMVVLCITLYHIIFHCL